MKMVKSVLFWNESLLTMLGKTLLTFAVCILLIAGSVSAQTRQGFTLKTGVLGQLYVKGAYNDKRQGFQVNVGPNGWAATIGIGIPVDLTYQKNNWFFSFNPVVRYAKLKDYSFSAVYWEEPTWGITIDLHLSAGYVFKKKRGILKNARLGAGFGLFNIGQPFDTYYSWSPNISFVPKSEFQATTLQFWEVHGLYERKLGKRWSVRAMLTYTPKRWIKWTPDYYYLIMGNLSILYDLLPGKKH